MERIVQELQRYLFDEIVADPIAPGGCLGLVYKGKCAIWFYKGWDDEKQCWYPNGRGDDYLARIQSEIGPSQDPQPDFSLEKWSPELDRTLHKWTPDGEFYLFTKKVSQVCSESAPEPLKCSCP